MPESPRFQHNPQTFVGVMGGNHVFVGMARRDDFDRIAAPVHDHGENERGHVLTKTVGGHGSDEVTVVFQYWLKSLTVEALMADREKAKAAAADVHREMEGRP